jgi:hypothetical protein
VRATVAIIVAQLPVVVGNVGEAALRGATACAADEREHDGQAMPRHRSRRHGGTMVLAGRRRKGQQALGFLVSCYLVGGRVIETDRMSIAAAFRSRDSKIREVADGLYRSK